MTKAISTLMSIFLLTGLIIPGFRYCFRPTVEIDCAKPLKDIGTYATGYLYGLAVQGVPSAEMVESLDISSVSQKTIGGLQHPIGDIGDIYKNLDSCDHIVVYFQDCFDTWYYCHEEINELRRQGNYNWQDFINTRFFPQVRQQLEKYSTAPYKDRLVYCLYNECDNCVWFGQENENGDLNFDDASRQNFYSAWKQTYDLVKSIDPDAKIGGPGYCDYNGEKLASFLSYCKENDCVPEVMIYHELQRNSSDFFEEHYEEYRNIEKQLGIEPLTVIVTEYGCMDECGDPGTMLDYICAMEKTGVYGNVAFWRLANNLCDTAADDNSPNSNWWLYRWYADMEGKLLSTRIVDIMHSDVANVVKYNRDRFHYVPLNGMAALNDSKDEISVILGGCDYTSYVALNNLLSTELANGYVDVKVESIYYKGLSAVVSSPRVLSQYTAYVANSLKVKVDCTDTSSVFRVTVKKANGPSKEKFTDKNIPVRYEFEDGVLLGAAYTYDSAYATTGREQGMVGGMENDGDGVSIKINVPSEGLYRLDIVYGKANDTSNPDGRVSAKVICSIDSNEKVIDLENTIKSEFTSCKTLFEQLTAGEHEITFRHKEGTYVLDSMLVSLFENEDEISVLRDSDRSDSKTSAFLAVSPNDGFYTVNITPNAEFLLDGAKCKVNENGTGIVYLRRGLNYIEVKDKNCIQCKILRSDKKLPMYAFVPSDMVLNDGAYINSVSGVTYLDGISSESGNAKFSVNVPKSGNYRMTISYSNNREGGAHSYNVDLIECYMTVEINGKSSNIWCRNTMSRENFKTVTANIELNEGENTVILSNNGENLFNNMTAYAPNVSGITFALACDG